MKNRVRFDKWSDPFAARNGSYSEEEGFYKDSYQKRYSGPAYLGPFGVIPIHEDSVPSKIYNFWMMHTNFNIDDKVIEKIENVPGVESLDVFSRYRARIGFGKIFNEETVQKKIKIALCKKTESSEKTEDKDELKHLKEKLSQKYRFWAILILKDKKMKILNAESQESLETKIGLEEYEKIHKSF
jgi:copper chaperone CopZ